MIVRKLERTKLTKSGRGVQHPSLPPTCNAHRHRALVSDLPNQTDQHPRPICSHSYSSSSAISAIHNPQSAMDPQPPAEFILDLFADPRSVVPLVKAVLHTIFFHRFFPSLTPATRDCLDLTLPYVDDDELETMIQQRAAALGRQLDAERTSQQQQQQQQQQQSQGHLGGATKSGTGGGGGRAQLEVQFFEKRRRKAWLSRGDEEVCWESWTVKVTVAEPRTESGKPPPLLFPSPMSLHPFR